MARGKEVCDETRPKKHIKSKNPINQWWFHPPSTTKKGALGAKGREVDKKDRTRPSKLPFNVICTTVTVGLYGLRHMHASWLSLSLSPCLAASFPFGLSRWPPSFFSQLYSPQLLCMTKTKMSRPRGHRRHHWPNGAPGEATLALLLGPFSLEGLFFRTLNCW